MNPLTQSKNTTILPRLIPLVLACFALSPSPVLADVVTDWNAIALQTVFSAVPPRPGPGVLLAPIRVYQSNSFVRRLNRSPVRE
jgi:hypothetical protein